MEFDALAGIVERHLPQFRDAVSEARLFTLEADRTIGVTLPGRSSLRVEIGNARDRFASVRAQYDKDQQIVENVRLPFPSVAVEDLPPPPLPNETPRAIRMMSREVSVLWHTPGAGRVLNALVCSRSMSVDSHAPTHDVLHMQFTPYPDGVLHFDFDKPAAQVHSLAAWRSPERGDFEPMPMPPEGAAWAEGRCATTARAEEMRERLKRHHDQAIAALVAKGASEQTARAWVVGDQATPTELQATRLYAMAKLVGAEIVIANPDMPADEAMSFAVGVAVRGARDRADDLREELAGSIAMFAGLRLRIAVLHILNISIPATFIVEVAPLAAESHKDAPGRIQRTQTRPRYVVLRPDAIRKVMRLPDAAQPATADDSAPTAASDKPAAKRGAHECRGHWRTLRSERYVNARGKVMWIKPHWCGPSESVVGRNRYRVILEREPPAAAPTREPTENTTA